MTRRLAQQIVIVVGIGALILIGFAWWATSQAQMAEERRSECLVQTEQTYGECLIDR